jgi:hypothetical protein
MALIPLSKGRLRIMKCKECGQELPPPPEETFQPGDMLRFKGSSGSDYVVMLTFRPSGRLFLACLNTQGGYWGDSLWPMDEWHVTRKELEEAIGFPFIKINNPFPKA